MVGRSDGHKLSGIYTVESVTLTELTFSPGTFTNVDKSPELVPDENDFTLIEHNGQFAKGVILGHVLQLPATDPVNASITSANPPLAKLQIPTE